MVVLPRPRAKPRNSLGSQPNQGEGEREGEFRFFVASNRWGENRPHQPRLYRTGLVILYCIVLDLLIVVTEEGETCPVYRFHWEECACRGT